MHEVLVVNASPLIFLGNADRYDLLHAIAGRVVVPQARYAPISEAVAQHRAKRGKLAKGLRWLVGWVSRNV